MRTLSGHSGAVDTVAFNQDDDSLASGSRDKKVKLWNPVTGRCLRTFSGHTDTVRSVAFSPDGRFIASGSSDNTIRIW